MKSSASIDDITSNRLAITCFIYSLIALLFSYGREQFWNDSPCTLCLYQRWILWSVAVVSISSLLSNHKPSLLTGIQALLLFFAMTSVYHLLIQYKVFPDFCEIPKNIKTLGDFDRLLYTSQGCSKITWRVFGIPVTAYNALLSILLSLTMLKKRKKFRKRYS